MNKCWCGVVGLVFLGLAAPASAQFGPPAGGKALDARLNKLEMELQKTQEHIHALIVEVSKMHVQPKADKEYGKGKFGKGASDTKIDVKKLEEIKRWYADKKWGKYGGKDLDIEIHLVGKGPKGHGTPWIYAYPPLHHGMHGAHHHGMHGMHHGNHSDALLLLILHELDAIRREPKKH